MIRRMGCGPAGRNGIAAGLAAAVLAVAMLLPAAPAEAGWLGRGLGVAGAARSLKRNLGEAVDLLDDTLGAAIQGDFAEVERLSGELREVPGNIITDAFPALSIGAAALEKADAAGERLKSARRRVGRFVGEAVADARMALEADEYQLKAGVLDPKKPLPAVTLSGAAGAKRPASAGPGAASAPDPWGQEPEEDEETATGGADPWGQDPEDEEPVAGDVDPPGEDARAGREGGDGATERLQGEYAAALDRFLGAEEGSSDYEATLSALLEREKELLAGVAGQEEQELTPDERRRVQACLAERELDPGAADGIFGPRTRTAIRAWQASQGREESGHLDQSSARTLLEECEVAVAEAETETTKATVERTFEPRCRALFDGQPSRVRDKLMDEIETCYIEFENQPDCHLGLTEPGGDMYMMGSYFDMTFFSTQMNNWIDSDGLYMWGIEPKAIPGVSWSGGCSGGVPDGQGTLSLLDYLYTREWIGRFVDGVPQGNWTDRSISGFFSRITKYSMMNGRLHGKYTIHDERTVNGDQQCLTGISEFVNGKLVRRGIFSPC